MRRTTLELDRGLMARLDRFGVRIDVADGNTIALKNVPANATRFSKGRTNLLMQRPRAGLPFIVGVDEDLQYVGSDPALARLFASGHRQHGWRVLRIDDRGTGPFQDVVERALKIIGFDGGEPALDASATSALPGARQGPLAAGSNVSELVRTGRSQPTSNRTDEIETVVSSVLQWQPGLPVIVGHPGVGKTNLVHGVARRLAHVRPLMDLIRVDLAEVFAGSLFDAERENLLVSLLRESASPHMVLCLERIDLVRLAMPEGPLVLTAALEDGVKIIGTALPHAMAVLGSLPLARRLHFIELTEPDAASVLDVLLLVRDDVAQHHQVTIDESIARAVVDRASSLDGVLPAKAIALMDAAASRAALGGRTAIELIHVYTAANDFVNKEEAAL